MSSLNRSESLDVLLQDTNPQVIEYINELEATNAKLQKNIIKLEASNTSKQNKIIGLQEELVESQAAAKVTG